MASSVHKNILHKLLTSKIISHQRFIKHDYVYSKLSKKVFIKTKGSTTMAERWHIKYLQKANKKSELSTDVKVRISSRPRFFICRFLCTKFGICPFWFGDHQFAYVKYF